MLAPTAAQQLGRQRYQLLRCDRKTPTVSTSQRPDSNPDWLFVSGSSLSRSTPTSAVLVELRRTNTFRFLRTPLRRLCLRSKRHLLSSRPAVCLPSALSPKLLCCSLCSLLPLPSLLLTFRGSKMWHVSIFFGTVYELSLSLAFGDCIESRLSCHQLVSINEH